MKGCTKRGKEKGLKEKNLPLHHQGFFPGKEEQPIKTQREESNGKNYKNARRGLNGPEYQKISRMAVAGKKEKRGRRKDKDTSVLGGDAAEGGAGVLSKRQRVYHKRSAESKILFIGVAGGGRRQNPLSSSSPAARGKEARNKGGK